MSQLYNGQLEGSHMPCGVAQNFLSIEEFDSIEAIFEGRMSRLEAAHKAEIEVERAATEKALNDALILRLKVMAYENTIENNSELVDCIAAWNEEVQKIRGLKNDYEKLISIMSTMIETGEKSWKEAEKRADWETLEFRLSHLQWTYDGLYGRDAKETTVGQAELDREQLLFGGQGGEDMTGKPDWQGRAKRAEKYLEIAMVDHLAQMKSCDVRLREEHDAKMDLELKLKILHLEINHSHHAVKRLETLNKEWKEVVDLVNQERAGLKKAVDDLQQQITAAALVEEQLWKEAYKEN
ncbi:unnamed protein product [Calypogeia fissa]